MNRLRDIFASPEFCPLLLDVEKRTLTFVRMSREGYQDSVFLDLHSSYVGTDSYDVELDDLLLASAMTPETAKPVHYILNTGFCCSTLLARYFELLPSCFVVKEPQLLAQLATMQRNADLAWDETLHLCLRLLTRTYEAAQIPIIKPVECCSLIAESLLAQNEQATATFLITSLRQFLLALLKSGERRDFVRQRTSTAFKDCAKCPALTDVNPAMLEIPEAAACLWLSQHYLCEQLRSGPHGSRVVVLDGQKVADAPKEVLSAVSGLCGLSLDAEKIEWMMAHPSIHRYSKDLSRPYDAESRGQELPELERCWGSEADRGIDWAIRHGWHPSEARLKAVSPASPFSAALPINTVRTGQEV